MKHLSSEIDRAKGTWFEAFETAGINPGSDFLKEPPLAVPAAGFGEGHGKLQRAISEETRKYRTLSMGRQANTKGTFLEALETAGIDPVSDFLPLSRSQLSSSAPR